MGARGPAVKAGGDRKGEKSHRPFQIGLAHYNEGMKELLRSNDLVYLSYLEAAMKAEGIATVILDSAMSVTEGSVMAIPRRLMVHPDDHPAAAAVLTALREADGDG